MSVRIDASYLGELGCSARHAPSGDTLATDAPVDNHGRGLHFSPTDLLATALGTCVLTTMALAAQARGIELKGTTASVEKEMSAIPRRHVGKLTVQVAMPAGLDDHARTILERAATSCPVSASLGTDTRVEIRFSYP